MPRTYSFVESVPRGADNGYLSQVGALGTRGGPSVVAVGSVAELVDHISATIGDDSLGLVTIYGHGAPGEISVGNGQTGANRGKSIALSNVETWKATIEPLKADRGRGLGAMVGASTKLLLRGCHVGANTEGAELLGLVCRELGVPVSGSVDGPVTACTADQILPNSEAADPRDNMQQTTHVGADTTSCGVTTLRRVTKMGPKEAGTGGIIRGEPPGWRGADQAHAAVDLGHFREITSARFLPRIPGLTEDMRFEEFVIPRRLFERGKKYDASPALIRLLSIPPHDAYVPSPVPLGMCVQGWLQFVLAPRPGHPRPIELPPWGITGGGRFGVPLGRDTRLLYEFGRDASLELVKLMKAARAGAHKPGHPD